MSNPQAKTAHTTPKQFNPETAALMGCGGMEIHIDALTTVLTRCGAVASIVQTETSLPEDEQTLPAGELSALAWAVSGYLEQAMAILKAMSEVRS